MVVLDWKRSSFTNGGSRSGNESIEGTSARVRPFSFEEVMLRRKNKKAIADVEKKASEQREHYGNNDNSSGSDHDIRNFKMDMKDKRKEGSRKIEESTSKKGEHHSKGRQKERSSEEIDVELQYRHHKTSSEKQGKNDTRDTHRTRNDDRYSDRFSDRFKVEPEDSDEKPRKNKTRDHHRTRTDDRLKVEFNEQIRKKRSNDMSTEYNTEKDYDYEKKKKRSRHTVGEVKLRSEIARSSYKKEFEHSERDLRHEKRHEMPKAKHRRSRSREHHHKRKKSISLSPRPRERSYHMESSSHYKGTSGKQYSDVDKYKTSGSGGYSGRHERHHGSGLGGYSPRKRRVQSTARSPSPTIHSPGEKGTTWDQPPGGSQSANLQPALTTKDYPQSSSHVTQDASKVLPVPSANSTTMLSNTADSIQLTQATRPMRRLHIENLPPSTSDKDMIEWLNGVLLESSSSQPQKSPIISCIINKEKSQAVVEFLTPEDTTSALTYDGKSFSGSILKIRRPKDFINMTSGIQDQPLAVIEANHTSKEGPENNTNRASEVQHVISDIVKDSTYKLFISGISKAISPCMLMEIISAFGPLKAYHFEINEELTQPCAFLEYLDHSVTSEALAGLNGMKLGGQILTVVRTLPSDHSSQDDTQCKVTYTIPEHARSLLENPTQVLKLMNVFNLEVFTRLSESDLEETLEDIRIECARFGTVKSINVVRHSCSLKTEAISEHNIEQKGPAAREESSVTHAMQDVDDISHCGSLDVENNYERPPPNDENSTEAPENKKACSQSKLIAHEQPLLSPKDGGAIDEPKDGGAIDEPKDGAIDELKELETENNPSLEDLNQQNEKSEINAIDIGKSDAKLEGGSSQTSHDNRFEPPTVLVEFLREEAACIAAHCLHGRLYGEQIVSAGYAVYDDYRAEFHR